MKTLTDRELHYESSLRDFVTDKGEDALKRAYEFGRQVVENGLDSFEIIRIHEQALVNLLSSAGSPDEAIRITRLSFRFLAETLSSFEMMQRGFQEVIGTLRTQADELAVTNRRLESENAERKKAEEALRKSEERYRLLVDTARDFIYTLSVDGLFTSLNPAFDEMMGTPRDLWIGKHFFDLVHAEDVPTAETCIKSLLKGTAPPAFEIRLISQRGPIVCEFVSTPQFQDGKVIGVFGVARDISPRRRAEEELRKNQDLFRIITENVSDLIVILDTQGRRLYNSLSYSPLLGNPKSLQGTNSFADVHPEDRDRIKEIFEETVQTGRGHRQEYRLLSKSGITRYIESQGNVVRGTDGAVEKVVVVSRDITDRKEVLKSLQFLAHRVVEAQEEERKRIARELHDDICQLLTATKLQMEAMESDFPDRRSKLARAFRDARKQITKLITETRRISANLRPAALDDLGLVQALGVLCTEFRENRRISVRYEPNTRSLDGVDPQIETTLYRISQEALANVSKHSSARTVTVQLAQAKGTLELTVRDDGVGFDATKPRRADHGGFGLISMRERAQLIGGVFQVHSTSHKGTTIHVKIPLISVGNHEKNQNPVC